MPNAQSITCDKKAGAQADMAETLFIGTITSTSSYLKVKLEAFKYSFRVITSIFQSILSLNLIVSVADGDKFYP